MDLTTRPPRPGDLALGEWPWLPRMIDKARATYYGNPGNYVHPCGRDRMLLARLGISVQEFKGLIDVAPTDEDVLRELRTLRRAKGLEEAEDAPADDGGTS